MYSFSNKRDRTQLAVGVSKPYTYILGGEEKIVVTSFEYKLLKLLMNNPKRVFTKKAIFEAVWEDEYLYDSNTIMVYISKLRDYIEEDSKNPQFIITVRGLGYKFGK